MNSLFCPIIVSSCFLVLVVWLGVATAEADIVVFNTDFDSGSPVEISGSGVLTGVEGYAGLGTIGNQFSGDFLRTEAGNGLANGIALTLTGLQSHTAISVDFLLAIIDSWDGNGSIHGPDRLAITVDGTTIFSEVFENSFSGSQSYIPPAGVELARHADLGFTPTGAFFRDSAYDMGQDPTFDNIAHTASTLTISWFRNGGSIQNSPTFHEESWALDNIRVTLHGTAIPEPSSLAVLSCGSLWLGQRRRRV